MFSRILTTFALLSCALSAAPVLAHPGHGTTDPQTVTHYAVEPVHVMPWLATVVVGVTLTLVIMHRLFGDATARQHTPSKP
ncbi:MAG: hypothetical protein R3B91_24000 [Planctomycetaceae bacterium]